MVIISGRVGIKRFLFSSLFFWVFFFFCIFYTKFLKLKERKGGREKESKGSREGEKERRGKEERKGRRGQMKEDRREEGNLKLMQWQTPASSSISCLR